MVGDHGLLPPGRKIGRKSANSSYNGAGRRYSRHESIEISAAVGGGQVRGAVAAAYVERATRIELAFSAWEADVLPLNYARVVLIADVTRERSLRSVPRDEGAGAPGASEASRRG